MKKQRPTYDGPNTLQNDEATVLWILAMIFTPAIKANFVMHLLTWVALTFCWYKHISRHDGGK